VRGCASPSVGASASARRFRRPRAGPPALQARARERNRVAAQRAPAPEPARSSPALASGCPRSDSHAGLAPARAREGGSRSAGVVRRSGSIPRPAHRPQRSAPSACSPSFPAPAGPSAKPVGTLSLPSPGRSSSWSPSSSLPVGTQGAARSPPTATRPMGPGPQPEPARRQPEEAPWGEATWVAAGACARAAARRPAAPAWREGRAPGRRSRSDPPSGGRPDGRMGRRVRRFRWDQPSRRLRPPGRWRRAERSPSQDG
jgi:hypothetical protein